MFQAFLGVATRRPSQATACRATDIEPPVFGVRLFLFCFAESGESVLQEFAALSPKPCSRENTPSSALCLRKAILPRPQTLNFEALSHVIKPKPHTLSVKLLYTS